MAIKDQAPVAPSSAVVKVLETYRETGLGGGSIDTTVLARLSLGDEIARRVAQALRILDLIDDQGKPTNNLIAFKQASSSEYKQVLAAQLYDVYAPVFAVLGKDLAGKTNSQIEDAFRTFRPESLRKRMVTLFLGLCDYTGIITALPRGKPGPKKGAPRKATPKPRDGSTPNLSPFSSFPPPPPQRDGEVFAVKIGEVGTVTMIVNVRWLELPDETLLALRKVTADLRSLGADESPADQEVSAS